MSLSICKWLENTAFSHREDERQRVGRVARRYKPRTDASGVVIRRADLVGAVVNVVVNVPAVGQRLPDQKALPERTHLPDVAVNLSAHLASPARMNDVHHRHERAVAPQPLVAPGLCCAVGTNLYRQQHAATAVAVHRAVEGKGADALAHANELVEQVDHRELCLRVVGGGGAKV